MNMIESFKEAVAVGGLEAGVNFASGLPKEQQQLLITEIENSGAGWVAIWLFLRLVPDESAT